MNLNLQEIKKALINSKSLPKSERDILMQEILLVLRNTDTKEVKIGDYIDFIVEIQNSFLDEFKPEHKQMFDGLLQMLRGIQNLYNAEEKNNSLNTL